MEPLAASRCPVCDRPYAPDESACGNPAVQPGRPLVLLERRHLDADRRAESRDQPVQVRRAMGMGPNLRPGGGRVPRRASRYSSASSTSSPRVRPTWGRTAAASTTRGWCWTRAAVEVSPGAVWPFDITGEPLIVKTGPTPPNGRERIPGPPATSPKARCVTPCGSPGPRTSSGKRVLVYDDVFTDGLTLNEVARALRLAGAD